MVRKQSLVRAIAVLAIGGVLAAGFAISPSFGAFSPTKKKVKNIAMTQAKKYFNKNIGDADVASVNGNEIHRFFHQAPANTTDQTIGTFGPLTLKATCDGAGDPTLRGSWNEETNNLRHDENGSAGNASTPAGSTINLSSAADPATIGHSEAVGVNSKFHTMVEYFLRDSPALGSNQCFFSGYVTVG